LRVARVFASYEVNFVKDANSAVSDVLEITDRSCD
jgi:hypothetical protein